MLASEIKSRLADVRRSADEIDALLDRPEAAQLPALGQAETLVETAKTAEKLAALSRKLAKQLQAGGAKPRMAR